MFLLPVVLVAQIVTGAIGVGVPEGPQLTAPASKTPPEQKCTLQGRVTDAITGEPVKKVSLHLRLINQTPSGPGTMGAMPQGYSATSEADGSFKFEGIEPGVYNFSGNRSGYLFTQYGARGPMQPGTNLTLRPSQNMADINLQLTPQAVISGKVVDEDGDPVGHAMVQALAQTWQRGKLRYQPRGGGQTDDRGEYRVANLSPGKYYVLAQRTDMNMPDNEVPAAPGKPDVRPVRTFFPDAINLESATPIEVRVGQDASGTDIRVRTAQTYHVRGKIVGEIPGNPEWSAVLSQAKSEGDKLVCANVFGLYWGENPWPGWNALRLLPIQQCSLGRLFPDTGFEERRV